MNVILCGMMGSGKTTVGKILAEELGVSHCDTDELIVRKYGEISTIFQRDGECRFREMERETVCVLSKKDGLVVSTGGGLVLDEGNVARLKKNGKIVYLRATIETLERRLEGDGTRPLLREEGALQRLMAQRASVYEGVADCIVDVDEKSPKEVAQTIRKLVQK